MKIYFIRHCKAEGQEREARLTTSGVEQACKLVQFFDSVSFDAIYSSPYKRALDTIKPTARKKGLEIIKDNRLAERVLSSQSIENWMEELQRTFTDFDYRLKGGESSKEAQQRGLSFINDLTVLGYDSVAVVTHGNLLSLLIDYYEKGFGYEGWRSLKNPDVFVLTHNEKLERLYFN